MLVLGLGLGVARVRVRVRVSHSVRVRVTIRVRIRLRVRVRVCSRLALVLRATITQSIPFTLTLLPIYYTLALYRQMLISP